MAHVLNEGERLAHCFGRDATIEQHVVDEETHLTGGRRPSLTDKAKEIVHDIAEMTMDLAHEVKEKLTGHITDQDIAAAAKKVADLQGKLADEQHQMREIEQEADRAERALEINKYEKLKQKEVRLKDAERETARKITEAEAQYWRLQDAHLKQKHE